jgi:hypothetical protein|uniref:Uncharacterized protein n=1 Tax=Panagrolaimus sp. PS1159 TaxID=55785 RepID=A0AC35F8Z2_9BILA
MNPPQNPPYSPTSNSQASTSLPRPLSQQQQNHNRQQFNHSQQYFNNHRNPQSINNNNNGMQNGLRQSSTSLNTSMQKMALTSAASQQCPPPSSRYSTAHTWQQSHFDSGFHSQTPSAAPSMMSFADSEMSLSSVMTMDVPQTQISEQNRRRIERVRTFFTGSDPVKSKEALPELIQLLNDQDEDVVLTSIEMLKRIYRSDNFRPPDVPAIANGDNNIVFAVKNAMMRHRNHKYIVHYSLCIFFYTSENELVKLMNEHKEDILDTAISTLNQTEINSYKYALLLVHTLVKLKEIGQTIIKYVREHQALTYIAPWLSDPRLPEKLISITVDTIYCICNKDEEQRSFFVVTHDGINKLVKILYEKSYPPMVENIIKLLHSIAIADKDEPNYSKRIVDAGIYRAISKFLNLELPVNYLYQILKLVKDLGDIRDHGDISHLLYHLIDRVEYPDFKVKQLSVECLVNLIANNAKNKEFLISNRALDVIIRLICQTEEYYVDENLKRHVEKIQESAIGILCHLCVNHSQTEYVLQTIPKSPLHFILLGKLMQSRPAILKQTLILLSRLSIYQSNVPIFLSIHLQSNGETHWYIPQVCRILNVAYTNINATLEDVKIYTLVTWSQNVLTKFCVDRSTSDDIFAFLHQMSFSNIQDPEIIIPFCILKSNIPNEPLNNICRLKMSALELILSLSKSVMASRYFHSNQRAFSQLQLLKDNPDFSNIIQSISNCIKETLQTPPMIPCNYGPPPPGAYYPPPPQQSMPYPPPPPYGQPGPSQTYPESDPYGYPSSHAPPVALTSATAACYPNPSSIPPPAYAPMSVEGGPRHEDLAYPVDEYGASYPPQSISTVPMDSTADYGSMAPQTSPYQLNHDSMHWK